MADPGDYEEDAARIDREYIPADATSEAEVAQALEDAGFPDAAQGKIQDWLVSEDDAWQAVGEGGETRVVDSGSVRRALDAESNGTVSDARADQIASDVGQQIDSARAEAAQRVGSDGLIRGEDGRVLGKPSNVEETVRRDGIYFRNTETGTTGRAAGFDR